MAAVTSTIFSHTQVAKKNMLVTMLIDHLWSNEPGLTDELAATLNELTSLNRSEHSRVALRARQVSFIINIHVFKHLIMYIVIIDFVISICNIFIYFVGTHCCTPTSV